MYYSRPMRQNLSQIAIDSSPDFKGNNITGVGSIDAQAIQAVTFTGDVVGNATSASAGYGPNQGLFNININELASTVRILNINQNTPGQMTISTVGPTGSGATIESSVMNSIPDGTKALFLYPIIKLSHLNVANGPCTVQVYFFKDATSLPNEVSFEISAYLQNESSVVQGMYPVGLTAQKTFKVYWVHGAGFTGQYQMEVYLMGTLL